MKRIFPEFAYGAGARDGCWWDETIAAPDWPVAQGDIRADVAIIGGGYTGLSAALHLARAGASVVLLEAQTPGWGASGRNGGFCCLGGGALDDRAMLRAFGEAATRDFRRAERQAVDLAADLIARFGIDADVHSDGETVLAHSPRAMEEMRGSADRVAKNHGVEPRLTARADLPAEGLGGDFHGALTIPIGFGLNPRKYLFGLARAASEAGARLYRQSAVTRLEKAGAGFTLRTARGEVLGDRVIVATNGYSSEDVPDWLAGRYMPAQSNVLVTRPLTRAECDAQAWTSDQMAYDSRNLLHYFRLMPDRRFLFGMRGGLISSPASEAAVRRRTRRHFERMFPAWRRVASDHSWSGMVCLARRRVPFVGPVPGQPGLYAGLAYHGNGVAMGSWAGARLAAILGDDKAIEAVPAPMRQAPTRFPLGGARRLLMPPLYAGLALADLG